MKTFHRITLGCLALIMAACGGAHVQQGDKVARVGDWETALIQYRIAVEQNPDDTIAKRRMWRAERKVIELYTKRGHQANSAGRLGEAGMWWKRAVDMADPLEKKTSDAWRAIEKNATALEYHGDVAYAEGKYEEAIGTWSAVLLVDPDKLELTQKNTEAQKRFASELHLMALSLARRDLLGAALVTDLRALRYDPMQSEAFSAGSELRRTIRSRTRIAVQEIRVEDKGFKGLAQPLLARLTPHMEDYPPYGPTKDANALRANFVVTIEDFTRDETTKEGKDELKNDEPPSTVPIPNPAIPKQKEKITALEKKLADLQAQLKAQVAARKAGRPVAYGADPGLDYARQIDQTKEDLAEARRVLGTLPAKVPPPPPPPTWTLPWKETTRTVKAIVRFEIHEPDFPEPVIVVMNENISKTDRTHEGNLKHRMPADPLKLPEYEEMVAELAKKLEGGAKVLGEARQRRVDTLIEKGRAHQLHGRESEALDAYVAVLFLMGPQALPQDAASFVAKALEHDRFKEVVALQ